MERALRGPDKLALQDLKRPRCHISSTFLNPALMRSMKAHILLLLGLHRGAPSSAALSDQSYVQCPAVLRTLIGRTFGVFVCSKKERTKEKE